MIRHKLSWLLAGAVLLTTAAGCFPAALTPAGATALPPVATAVQAPAQPLATQAAPTQAATTPAPTRTFTAATLVPAAPVITEEATVVSGAPTPFDPALQQMATGAQADLARRLGIGSDQVEVVEVQMVTWPDGGLGCPQPGMAYTQVQVEGLLIRLRAAGRVYEYHSGGSRPPFLCEQRQ